MPNEHAEVRRRRKHAGKACPKPPSAYRVRLVEHVAHFARDIDVRVAHREEREWVRVSMPVDPKLAAQAHAAVTKRQYKPPGVRILGGDESEPRIPDAASVELWAPNCPAKKELPTVGIPRAVQVNRAWPSPARNAVGVAGWGPKNAATPRQQQNGCRLSQLRIRGVEGECRAARHWRRMRRYQALHRSRSYPIWISVSGIIRLMDTVGDFGACGKDSGELAFRPGCRSWTAAVASSVTVSCAEGCASSRGCLA